MISSSRGSSGNSSKWRSRYVRPACHIAGCLRQYQMQLNVNTMSWHVFFRTYLRTSANRHAFVLEILSRWLGLKQMGPSLVNASYEQTDTIRPASLPRHNGTSSPSTEKWHGSCKRSMRWPRKRLAHTKSQRAHASLCSKHSLRTAR